MRDALAMAHLAESLDAEASAQLADLHGQMRRLSLVLFGSDDIGKHGVRVAIMAGHGAESAARIVAWMRHRGLLGAAS